MWLLEYGLRIEYYLVKRDIFHVKVEKSEKRNH